jgi:hypothetical protein
MDGLPNPVNSNKTKRNLKLKIDEREGGGPINNISTSITACQCA